MKILATNSGMQGKNRTSPFFKEGTQFFLQIENRNLVRGFPFYHFGLAVYHFTSGTDADGPRGRNLGAGFRSWWVA